MIEHASPSRGRPRRVALIAIGLLFVAACSANADTAGSGFVARAQRADLVVVGQVARRMHGLLGGCGHTITVERVLRGSLSSNTIELHSELFSGGCPPLSMKNWLVLAFDRHPEKIDRNASNYPPGTSWRLVLDAKGDVHGDLTSCHGVTLADGGRVATNEVERMPLRELELLLAQPDRRLCGSPPEATTQPPRTIEGQVVDSSGAPARTPLEFSPAREAGGVIGLSPGADGGFQIEGMSGGPVWVRATNQEFDPFLLPPAVRRVTVVVPTYPHADNLFGPE